MELAWRLLALCLALAGVETLHGIARMTLLVPRVGRRAAQRIAIVTGTLLAFAVCRFGVPPLGLSRGVDLLALGLFLATFMAAFDVLIARAVARRPWRAVAADFDPRQGNYLIFGLLALVFIPLAVMATATGAGRGAAAPRAVLSRAGACFDEPTRGSAAIVFQGGDR